MNARSIYLNFLLFILLIVVFAMSHTAVLAVQEGGQPGGPREGGQGFTLQNPITADSFSEVMRRVANIAALIGLPIVVLMIIWTGAQFVFAGGDEKKLTAAKQSFYWTVIGALLVLGAYVIAAAIENFARQL